MQLFTKLEIRDIVVSVVAVAFIFSVAFIRTLETPITVEILTSVFGVFLIIVIIAFLFHELAHKFTAQRYGSLAAYKIFPWGLLIGLAFALLVGVAFVAPGAVVIYPFKFGRWKQKESRLTAHEMGVISVAGIALNLIFAAIFFPLSGLVIIQGLDLFALLSFVNAWLALFNLLPIPPLDGRKVMSWKIGLWAFLFIVAIALSLPFFLA